MLASTLVNGRSYFRTISRFFNHSFGKFKYRVLTLKKKYMCGSYFLMRGKGPNTKYTVNLVHHMLVSIR